MNDQRETRDGGYRDQKIRGGVTTHSLIPAPLLLPARSLGPPEKKNRRKTVVTDSRSVGLRQDDRWGLDGGPPRDDGQHGAQARFRDGGGVHA